MRSRPAAGEVGLALVFAAVGLVGVIGGLRLPLWEGFAPQSGFLPLAYGVLLTGLALAILIGLFFGAAASGADQPVGKALLVLAAVTTTVIGVEPAGFGVAVFLLLAFLFAVVERLPILRSLVAAGAITAALILIFRAWLGVPLPAGPLGI
jgi:Tripartite tricarboxylate transporter TctB family